MGRLYHKLLSLLNISGRDLAVFLLALLLAFSIWLIHNLALKYNAYLDVTVQASCNIDGHAELSSDYSNVVARCRATGYNVIKSGILGDRRVKVIRFQPSAMKHKHDDIYYVTSENLQEYAHLIFGDGVSVEYFSTDTLFFRFPSENSRKVPVRPVSSVSYLSQYVNESDMVIEPDSVIIYGEPSILDNVDAVYTKPIRHSHVSKDIAGEVGLEKIAGIRLSEDKIHYSMGITRYVEFEQGLKVNIHNLPPEKTVTILPSVVKVVLRCVFPTYGNPFDVCTASVDYNEYVNSLSGKCVVKLENLPSGVIDYEISPSFVEFIVEESN